MDFQEHYHWLTELTLIEVGVGIAIAILLNVLLCFVWWVSRGLIRRLRNQDLDQHPDLPRTSDPKIDTGNPLGVWFPNGLKGESFVGFYQGPENEVAYLKVEGTLPVEFKIGDRLRYKDPISGGVWSLPTRVDDA